MNDEHPEPQESQVATALRDHLGAAQAALAAAERERDASREEAVRLRDCLSAVEEAKRALTLKTEEQARCLLQLEQARNAAEASAKEWARRAAKEATTARVATTSSERWQRRCEAVEEKLAGVQTLTSVVGIGGVLLWALGRSDSKT